MFVRGSLYTRRQIHDTCGGSVQSYLPHVGVRVVCACLRPDINPNAPRVILVGDGKDVMHSAELLCRQSEPIPVFLKRASNEWEYVGEYAVECCTSDPNEVRRQADQAGRDDITRVIFMVKVNSKGS